MQPFINSRTLKARDKDLFSKNSSWYQWSSTYPTLKGLRQQSLKFDVDK